MMQAQVQCAFFFVSVLAMVLGCACGRIRMLSDTNHV